MFFPPAFYLFPAIVLLKTIFLLQNEGNKAQVKSGKIIFHFLSSAGMTSAIINTRNEFMILKYINVINIFPFKGKKKKGRKDSEK